MPFGAISEVSAPCSNGVLVPIAKGLMLAFGSAEDHPEAERSLRLSIEWAVRQLAALPDLRAAMDLAELLLKEGRALEAYEISQRGV
jgi:hypothetical protein